MGASDPEVQHTAGDNTPEQGRVDTEGCNNQDSLVAALAEMREWADLVAVLLAEAQSQPPARSLWMLDGTMVPGEAGATCRDQAGRACWWVIAWLGTWAHRE